MSTKRLTFTSVLGVAAVAGALMTGSQVRAEEATVIELTQVPCQFLESENGVDHGYTTTSKADCEAINARTGEERLAASNTLNLAPGKYIFRVKNEDVPYPLGFWIREHDYNPYNPVHKATKTSVSGGGLTEGATRDYEVVLEAGTDYVYSCPLNPTPDSRIVVH